MELFAVIDTETNWFDRVMSVGTVIADAGSFKLVSARYHIFPDACALGGMYEGALFLNTPVRPILCSREEGLEELERWLNGYGVVDIFAYNARFDCAHLPELSGMQWYDIMRLAAYRQYNPAIPPSADCCSTGRLKRNYGVEAMLRLLSDDPGYCETHNALFDAMDELEIMHLMGISPTQYIPL